MLHVMFIVIAGHLQNDAIYFLLSVGRTVVKCICECDQSGHSVVFDPEPVDMSTTFCTRVSVCSVSPILLFQKPCVMKVIPWMLPLRNGGDSHWSPLCRVG